MSLYLERLTYYQPEMTKALWETGYMLTISTLAAMLLGLPLGTYLFLTGKQGVAANRFLSLIFNSYVNIVRSFPFLLFVIALIPLTRFLIGSSFGTYAATFPLSLVAIAIYARLVEQVLLDVPSDAIELAHSLGATNKQLIFDFLYIEARSGLVLSLTSLMISMVSYSTVMGVIGGGGIGDFAIRYGYQRYEYDMMYTTIIIMITMVIVIQLLGSKLSQKIDKRKK
ncbi:ABC transporter permease [Vagococcus sp. BWB3-3]|uniref:ABC transporter permease n=1 Tax=Vagococcus allomyrinae TaxID=2794353 RepID=A0A940ST37_9ENTE|nr:methionine ABC transporter permease [Vagococcus allomyrinae]MBP1039900.1 ABC transporter permease [Vagococcus allomyrinae]